MEPKAKCLTTIVRQPMPPSSSKPSHADVTFRLKGREVALLHTRFHFPSAYLNFTKE